MQNQQGGGVATGSSSALICLAGVAEEDLHRSNTISIIRIIHTYGLCAAEARIPPHARMRKIKILDGNPRSFIL